MTLLQITLLIGLAGAALMFAGDMILYFDKNDYQADEALAPIIAIMKKEPRSRLYIGGILGPVSAFVYCLGYYHLVLLINNESFAPAGWILFLINCLGIICGGAYHSHCAYLGLIGRLESKEALDEVLKYMNVQKSVSFGLQAIGFLGLAVLIAFGKTVLPRWMAMLTPGILMLLLPLMKRLPKGLHMVLCGGWTNLISVIYYAAAFLAVIN